MLNKKVLYLSQFKDRAGYAEAARGYLKSLISVENDLDLKCVVLHFENYSEEVDNEYSFVDDFSINEQDFEEWSEEGFLLLWHMPAPTIKTLWESNGPHSTFLRKIIKRSTKNIHLASWETDSVPKEWRECYEFMNPSRIILSSKWNQEVFSEVCDSISIPLLTKEIPNETFGFEGLEKVSKDKMVFFSASQWNYRKGFDVLVKSYLTEFNGHDDVLLIIKTYITNIGALSFKKQEELIREDIERYKKSLWDKDIKFPPIVLICDIVKTEELQKLYEISDVFVLPTRGEGFGYTISEAIQSGLPVIVPDKGGHLDFVHKSNFFVNSYKSPCQNLHGYSFTENIFEPSILSVKEEMRKCYNMFTKNRQKLREIGEMSKVFGKSVFSNKGKIGNDLLYVISQTLEEKLDD